MTQRGARSAHCAQPLGRLSQRESFHALPGVPLNGELLTALSVGLPIGLGAYLAWVRRDWSGNIKTIGLTAAVAGAIVGAWLGFHSTGGILALITTIVGAAAGANLILLVTCNRTVTA